MDPHGFFDREPIITVGSLSKLESSLTCLISSSVFILMHVFVLLNCVCYKE